MEVKSSTNSEFGEGIGSQTERSEEQRQAAIVQLVWASLGTYFAGTSAKSGTLNSFH
jgi:hypothetical protein